MRSDLSTLLPAEINGSPLKAIALGVTYSQYIYTPSQSVEVDYSRYEMDGATLGLAILPVFNSVVEDIHLLHAVRDSSNNFKANSARLKITQVQLTRWGKAVGLDVDKIEDSQFEKLIPKEHQDKAKAGLSSMQWHLKEAQKRASKYVKQSEDDVEVFNEKARRFSLSRLVNSQTKEMTILQKVRWGLYEKGVFEELLDNIAKLLMGLEALFPGTESTRRQLTDRELQELGADNLREDMKYIEGWHAGRDDTLKEALAENEKQSVSSGTTNHWGINHGGAQIGGTVNNSTFSWGNH